MEVLRTAAAALLLPRVALLRPPPPPTARAPRLQPLRARRRQRGCCYLEPKCTLLQGRRRPARTSREEQVERIRERLRAGCAEQPPPSSSAYDTAWVAMVPAAGGGEAAPAGGTPRFPRCVEWIMDNQHADGSWGLAGRLRRPALAKDAASATLACVLALRTWGRRRRARQESTGPGGKAYMAYVAEGLGDVIQDWGQVLAYQSKNGSLFNSPSATSALAIHCRDANALEYLDSLANKFGSSIPIAYPTSMHSQLCMVDTLENMGIHYHFSSEIRSILDMAHRSWQQNDEEILMDMETCSMAFRILRMHGYDVSSDVLSHFAEESAFHESVQGHLNDTRALLELYKASQVRVSEDEWTLENIGSWTGKLLKQQVSSKRLSRRIIPKEVEYALQIPFYSAALEPLVHKRNIEHFDIRHIQMRKSAYLACQAADEVLALAIEEFHSSQPIYQQEVKYIESWFKEVGLDQLKFARESPLFIWIFMASIAFPPELSDARIASIKNTLLTVAVDDFFDGGGSAEEQENLAALIEKWEKHGEIGFCSRHVEVMFRAVYDTMSQIGEQAAKVQNRSVTGHIAQIWVEYLRSNVVEAEWTRDGYVPTMEEYEPVAEVSSAICPILGVPLLLAGPALPDEVIRGAEYRAMLRHTSLCTRFLNDLGTHGKESGQGCVNAVLLRAHRGGGGAASRAAAMEAAEREVGRAAAASRRELLRLVLREDGASGVPRPCRELFWNMCKVAHVFYARGDGFLSLRELMAAASAAVCQPLQLQGRSPPSR